MQWNWQHPHWPEFTYDAAAIAVAEGRFLQQSGIVIGVMRHINGDDRDNLIINLLSDEAVKTSEIEGEILRRESVQASVRQNFGIEDKGAKASPAEKGIADMMTSLYRHYNDALTHEMLYHWHALLTQGRTDINDIGRYRTHTDPMQIVSGADYRRTVHFEAPPSTQIHDEMTRFIDWFNTSRDMPPLTRASIAHIYFESIHPFEDGNGRIGRALVEKSLSQNVGQPVLLALSHIINAKKKQYYLNLERSNQDIVLTDWIKYFADTILQAQDYALQLTEFLIAKTKLYDRVRGQLNERQEKLIARMFREGVEGFKGGLSAENYMTITGATRPTTTRDLADLIEKNVLTKTGERRHTRYWLCLNENANGAGIDARCRD